MTRHVAAFFGALALMGGLAWLFAWLFERSAVTVGGRRTLSLASAVLAWAGMLVLAYVALELLGYLIDPFGPSCMTSRPGVPPHPTLPLAYVYIGAPVIATFFVGLYLALGVRSFPRRWVGVCLVLGATLLAAGVGLVLTPICV
jgi:hypothetical protein